MPDTQDRTSLTGTGRHRRVGQVLPATPKIQSVPRHAKPRTEDRVALLLDMENLDQGSNTAALWNAVVAGIADLGVLTIRRAYADWRRPQTQSWMRPLADAGVMLAQLPSTAGKNGADIAMCVDAMELLYTRSDVTVFVLATGDSDYAPLVTKLREAGKFVVGIHTDRNRISKKLSNNCDLFRTIAVPSRKSRVPEPRPGAARPQSASAAESAERPTSGPGSLHGVSDSADGMGRLLLAALAHSGGAAGGGHLGSVMHMLDPTFSRRRLQQHALTLDACARDLADEVTVIRQDDGHWQYALVKNELETAV